MPLIQSLYRSMKLSTQTNLSLIRVAYNIRHQFFDATRFSPKILEILDENQHNKPVSNTSKKDEINEYNNNTHQFSDYQNEMQALITMNTLESRTNAWKLFLETKNTNINKNVIDFVYSPAIKLTIAVNLCDKKSNIVSKKGFNKLMALKEEIQSKNNNETSTVQCDIMIINTCLKVKQYKKIMAIFEDILKNKEKQNYFINSDFCGMIVKFYGESNYVFEGIKFMQDIESKYKMLANNEMICELLKGIAYSINKQNKMLYLPCVEMLFEQSFGEQNIEKYPDIFIFQSIFDIYSKLGDIDMCVKLMRHIIHNEQCFELNVICYNLVLRACLKCDDKELLINNENGWYFVDEILNAMNKHNVIKNQHVYDTLFLFCGQNNVCAFDRLMQFYNEMSQQTLNVSLITLRNWVIAGMDCFQYQMKTTNNNSHDINIELICNGVAQFKDFASKECERLFPDSMSLEMKQNIETRAASILLLTARNNNVKTRF